MSSLAFHELHKLQKPLPHGVNICLSHVNSGDNFHRIAMRQLVRRVIANDAKEHGVIYDEKDNAGFERVIAAFEKNKIKIFFITIEAENLELQFAGGAIQFPTVIPTWDGNRFIYAPADYSEDTWVDRTLSDEIRRLTVSADFPRGIGLGTFSTEGRAWLSVAGARGSCGELPFGMISYARISENAVDNKRQLAILGKFGDAFIFDKHGSPVIEFKGITSEIKKDKNIPIRVCGLGATFDDTETSVFQSNIFSIEWISKDGDQQLALTGTEALSTTTGNALIRYQCVSNGRLPTNDSELAKILATLIATGNEIALARGWMSNNADPIAPPLSRVHTYDRRIGQVMQDWLQGTPRKFGERLMHPGTVYYPRMLDPKLKPYISEAHPMSPINLFPSLQSILGFVDEIEAPVSASA